MDIMKSLYEFGLTEKESTIYTTLLQIGEGSILDISKHCSLKRPTIYNGIESLESQGLVHRTLKGKRVRFKAESPESLIVLHNKKREHLEDLVPQLLAITNVPRGTKPETRFFEGKDAVNKHYLSTFSKLDEKDEIYFITSMRDLQVNFSELVSQFNTQAVKWKWKVKELMPDNKPSREYVDDMKKSVQKNPNHQVRLLPKNLDLFDTEILITKNTISLLSTQKEIFAISIESSHFTASFQAIFNALWLGATKIK